MINERISTLGRLCLSFTLLSICYFSFGQNVGVGTTSPNSAAVLDISVPDPVGNPQGVMLPRLTSAQRGAMTLGLTEAGIIVYDSGDSTVYKWTGSVWESLGGAAADDLGTHVMADTLETNGNWISGDGDAEGMFITPAGATGFGTSTPLGPFHVAVDTDGTPDSLFMVDAGANVGVGMVPTGTFKIEIAGNIGTVGINEISDRRWKQDIRTYENAIGAIIQMRGVRYNWNREDFPNRGFSAHPQIGLIAQEVEAVVPEVVATDSKGFKSVEYSKLVAVLIEGMKEQQKEIEALQEQVRELQRKNQEVGLK